MLSAIYLAGILHLLIASANFFAAKRFRYRDNLSLVTPIVRDVFIVQNLYIVLILCGLAAACFAFAGELAGGSPMGRALSGFLALFWTLRIGLQLFFYDRDLRRQHPGWNALFLSAYLYLATVFALAVLS